MLAAAVSLFPGSAAAQQGEPALLKRAAELRAAPADTGRSLATLPAQAPVTRLGERQGAWIQVQSAAGVAGWVHMFDVGPAGLGGGAGTSAPAGGNPVTSGLRGISNMLSGGSSPPPRVATSTIGIRGLEAEDLARAQPNLNAVGQMERLRQGEGEARQFAADAALVAATVPALPAPARASSPQGDNANR
jgi:Bacterial SH3 domain